MFGEANMTVSHESFDPSLEPAMTPDDWRKIEALEWLVFDSSQRSEAIKQCNALMRTFLGELLIMVEYPLFWLVLIQGNQLGFHYHTPTPKSWKVLCSIFRKFASFAAAGKFTAANEVFQKIPAGSIDMIHREWNSKVRFPLIHKNIARLQYKFPYSIILLLDLM